MSEPCRIDLPSGHVALVSPEDYDRVAQYRWCAWKSPRRPGLVYARHSFRVGDGWACIWMHRFLTDAPEGVLVDHRDHDGLNNTRSNLRLTDNRRNQQNVRPPAARGRSGFKGVSFNKPLGKWTATISCGEIKPNGKRRRVHLGAFNDPAEAARAYDAAALKHFGEFAALNFSANDSKAVRDAG